MKTFLICFAVCAFSAALDIHTNRDEILFVLRLQRECFSKTELSSDIRSVRREYKDTFGDVDFDAIVSNPINVLILYNFWERHSLALAPVLQQQFYLRRNLAPMPKMPSREEANDAAFVLLRLQRVYALGTVDLIKGKILGHQAVRGLSKRECFQLAKVAM